MPNDEPQHRFSLGPNNYGKSGIRLVRVGRETPRHEIRDLTVHTALAGDLDATHYTGDNTGVLPTDTQKNTVYALARDGIGPIEAFAERLARHFVDRTPAITTARVQIEEQAWTRIGDHSFTRGERGELRTAEAVYDGEAAAIASGVRDLLLLNTTDSEFNGFLADEYTTLPETDDRILATAVTATWTYTPADTAVPDIDTGATAADTQATAPGHGITYDRAFYDRAFTAARGALLEAFADTYSLSLQQTLYAVGERILRAVPEIGEVRLSLPNRHHYLFDLERFGLDNPGVVFQAGDLPYGLIEGTVRREAA
ncbi:factor-independent urate hydroxylase [Glycomyces sp. NRRL B-16210]|uniref:factor-independent urate hydroxylase n=1 Tax=Glycomyces sp. NRRL B-16210 TaxID=1463821 RepID=UPI0004C09B05|nr:urate oxidase [Glycomyces sp. NRRL B-16210]